MRAENNSALRRSGVGNIFIKNLDPAIDSKHIYETFSHVGKILSCKVVNDENGVSKGHGYVQYETEESAIKAISIANGMLANGRKLFVGKFIPRNERVGNLDEKTKIFTNVYVNNLPDDFSDHQLKNLFQRYGEITSLKLAKKEDGTSNGFGFVNFKEAAHAQEAVNAMNKLELNGKQLYVGRAQKKAEREEILKKEYEQIKGKQNGINLFIKNIDDTVDTDRLREKFSRFGSIKSAEVKKKDGKSVGFGFVCFHNWDDAARAIGEMNGRMLGRKPLYVALAQRREDRSAQFACQPMDAFAGTRLAQPHPANCYITGNVAAVPGGNRVPFYSINTTWNPNQYPTIFGMAQQRMAAHGSMNQGEIHGAMS